MIFVMCNMLALCCIVAMLLLLTKRNVQLQVYYTPPNVQVLPLIAGEEEERLLSTIARNEELLLHTFLSDTELYNPSWQLPQYFEGKGWQVELDQNLF